MSNWERHRWTEFDPYDLPWSVRPASGLPVTGRVERLERLTDPIDRRDAMELNFDPDHTFFTKLARPWRNFKPGTRVLLEATEVAVELPRSEK